MKILTHAIDHIITAELHGLLIDLHYCTCGKTIPGLAAAEQHVRLENQKNAQRAMEINNAIAGRVD